MSRLGKILLLVAGFCILISGVSKVILGGWHNYMYVGIVIFFMGVIVSFIVDLSFYKEFFVMRTTKHGMNMGVLILLFILGVFAVNFLAVKNNKKWDLTAEGLNSLSDQSVKILKSLDAPLSIKFFYRGGTEGVASVQGQFKELTEMYKDESSQFSVEFIDSIKRPGLAKEYGVSRATAQVFVDYKGKRNSVEPLTEEGLTKALLKATRTSNKKVFMTTGHGEKSVEDTGPTGLSEFQKSLKDSGYDVETLSLIDQKEVPQGADAVFIVGPQTSFLKPELAKLRDYARRGGKIFIAIDPGLSHNLALLTKSLGVEFRNDYVLDQFGQLLGASAAMALGRSYGTTDITKDFSGRMTMFHLASSVSKAPDTEFTISDLVKTGDTSFSSDKIAHGQVEVQADRRGPHTLGVLVQGVMPEEGITKKDTEGKGREFTATVFGDSDFLSNQLLYQQMNRDLGLNASAYLLKENELISIRPKQPKGTTLTLSSVQFWIFVFGVIVPIPLFLFGLSGFTWYRRRSA